MTPPTFAAKRRHHQHGAHSYRYLLPAGRSAANLPAAVAAVDWRDKRTDTWPLHRPCCAHYTSSDNNSTMIGLRVVTTGLLLNPLLLVLLAVFCLFISFISTVTCTIWTKYSRDNFWENTSAIVTCYLKVHSSLNDAVHIVSAAGCPSVCLFRRSTEAAAFAAERG